MGVGKTSRTAGDVTSPLTGLTTNAPAPKATLTTLGPDYLEQVGRFIVFEGGEAAGKSTQAALLAERLGAVLTREPGGTAVGEALRRLLLDLPLAPVPKAEALLMLADRAQHVSEVIEPALTRGQDVVCDRYSGSTLAYQGYGRGLSLADLGDIDQWATGGRAPDIVILLDLPAEDARRRRGSSSLDRIEAEGEEFLERARSGFRQLAAEDPQRWRVVDASGRVEDVAERVWKAVDDATRAREGRP
jgi:dTMP kinase